MGHLNIYSNNSNDVTVINNRFFDEYMKDANDAQLKVYLYLLRVMNANLPIGISDIADKFNHTEKDIIRSLMYWEKMKLLTLEYDEFGNIVGIHMQDFSNDTHTQNTVFKSGSGQKSTPSSSNAVSFTASSEATAKEEKATMTMQKPSYTASDLEKFNENPDVAQILFIAETYLGKTLSDTEVRTLLFIYDVLNFSTELMDYLIEYCVGKGKKDIRYIERVAVDWAGNDITTVSQAKQRSTKYDKTVYSILKALGRTSTATDTEAAYITKWLNNYAFSPEIILYACEKTVLATDSHRLEYADGILSRWLSQGIRTKEQIKTNEEKFQQSKKPAKNTASTNNKFNNFTQNSYDFASLEQELLSN